MTKPYRQNKVDRLINPGAKPHEIRCDYAVAPLDRVALDMDRKWGIDRLPSLVAPAMAEKYGAAMAHLNSAIDENDPAKVADAANNCMRGLAAMDAAATAAGHKPITPLVWEYELDGNRFGVVQSSGDWPAVAVTHPGLTTYTLREVALALASYKNALPINESVKAAFPGAQISAVRTPLEISLDDEIPY